MNAKYILAKLANKFLSRYNRKIVINVKVDRRKREKWIQEFLFKQSKGNLKKILTIEDL